MKCWVRGSGRWLTVLFVALGILAMGELALRFRYRQRARRSTSAAPGAHCVVAFGDSIVAGSPGPVEEAWPCGLQARLNRALPGITWSVRNAGISGDTSSKGCARFERDVSVHRPDVVLIAFGMNDCYPARQGLDGWLEGEMRTGLHSSYLLRAVIGRTLRLARRLGWMEQPAMEPTTNQPRTSSDGFSAALAILIDRCRATAAEPVLLSMTPLGCDHLEGVRLRLPLYRHYNAIIQETAARKRVKWVNLSEQGSDDLLQPDGFHLTAAGQRWVADRVFAVLESERLWARVALERR